MGKIEFVLNISKYLNTYIHRLKQEIVYEDFLMVSLRRVSSYSRGLHVVTYTISTYTVVEPVPSMSDAYRSLDGAHGISGTQLAACRCNNN